MEAPDNVQDITKVDQDLGTNNFALNNNICSVQKDKQIQEKSIGSKIPSESVDDSCSISKSGDELAERSMEVTNFKENDNAETINKKPNEEGNHADDKENSEMEIDQESNEFENESDAAKKNSVDSPSDTKEHDSCPEANVKHDINENKEDKKIHEMNDGNNTDNKCSVNENENKNTVEGDKNDLVESNHNIVEANVKEAITENNDEKQEDLQKSDVDIDERNKRNVSHTTNLDSGSNTCKKSKSDTHIPINATKNDEKGEHIIGEDKINNTDTTERQNAVGNNLDFNKLNVDLGKAMGIWEESCENNGKLNKNKSKEDGKYANIAKLNGKENIINKVQVLRCIMCNAAIRFVCDSESTTAVERRAFKGKYRNHLLAEHNADDRYAGMEILVQKTFELQFPQKDKTRTDNIEQRKDTSLKTQEQEILEPEIVLHEDQQDDEDIILDKQIPPRYPQFGNGMFRNNRFMASNMLPPGLEITATRNPGMQIGRFMNPSQRNGDGELVCLDDEEEDDDTTSSSDSDSSGTNPLEDNPVEVVLEEKEKDDEELNFDDLPSKKGVEEEEKEIAPKDTLVIDSDKTDGSLPNEEELDSNDQSDENFSEKLPLPPELQSSSTSSKNSKALLPLPSDLKQQNRDIAWKHQQINKATGLPFGWRKESRRRRVGPPGFDIIVHNPKGRIFRSRKELKKYCEKHPRKTMGINPRFVFSNIGINNFNMYSQQLYHDPRSTTLPNLPRLPLPPELQKPMEIDDEDSENNDVECIEL